MRVLKLLLMALAVMAVISPVWAQPPLPEIEGGEILASGFNGPQGVLVDADGNVWVIDSGLGGEDVIEFVAPANPDQPVPSPFGLTARVVRVAPDGEQTDVAVLPSVFAGELELIGGARLALLDGTLYATNGQWIEGLSSERLPLMAAVVRIDGEATSEVADLWAYEEANNPDGTILDSHPYGITAGPDGWLWVTDAAANTLLRVDPDGGDIELVAAFEGLPGVFPNPIRGGELETDPVPTAVAFDDEGSAYVSLLSGVPFIPGSAKVLHVTPDGEVSDYATGLTMLTDLRRGPDGELYAVQFGLFTEEGPVPDSGAVLRVREGDASEVIVSGLPFPTSIDFDADGSAYVTINGVGAPGSGAVVRFEGLTALEGQPLAGAN
jgi:sugar lactone lactonase YvrE